MPLSHPPGHAQCDFGEALVVIGGVEQKAHCFVIDLPHSDGCFVKAYPSETQDDCKVREFVRRGGRWSVLGGRRSSWLAGAWTSGVETILPGAERSARC